MSKKTLTIETPIMPATMAGQVGVLALANEDRFSASHYSEAMTEFGIGVLGTDLAALQAELDLIAPPVRSPRKSEYKKKAESLAFLADGDDERAIGASFRKVNDKSETVLFKVPNRGLSYTLDRDEMMDGDIEQKTKVLMSILLRNAKLRAINLIDAAATNQAVSFKSTTDPDALIEAALLLAHGARGLYPNQAISGLTAWSYRKNAYRSSDKNGAMVLGSMTQEEVASVLALDRFQVSKDVYKASKKGAKAEFLSNLIYAYYVDPIADKDDASNVKRFYTPCEGGEMFRVYVDDSQVKTVEVIVECYSLEAVTDSTGIRKLTVSNT